MPLPCNWGWMAGTSTLQPLPCGLEAGLEPGCEPLSWICGKHWSRSCALPMAAPSAASQPCGCSGDHAADGAVRPPRSVPGPCTIPLPPLRLWVGRGCSCAPLSRSCGQLRSGGCVPPMTAPPPRCTPASWLLLGLQWGPYCSWGYAPLPSSCSGAMCPPSRLPRATAGAWWGLQLGLCTSVLQLWPALEWGLRTTCGCAPVAATGTGAVAPAMAGGLACRSPPPSTPFLPPT